MNRVKISFRKVLLSSGDFTSEAVIDDGKISVFESAPEGLTVGLKEKEKEKDGLPEEFVFEYDSLLSQEDFDLKYAKRYGSDISSALSLAYIRYRAACMGFKDISNFLSADFNFQKTNPRLIFNILNGGKHASNGLSFCEFMIMPKDDDLWKSITVASHVYNDLKGILIEKYSEKDVLVGREGGFAPHISSIDVALELIIDAINARHQGEVDIAIDVAANHFTLQSENFFSYKVNDKQMTTEELFLYYRELLSCHPEIKYIEDCFHENDLEGWSLIMNEFGNTIDIVADDLTVTKREYAKKYLGLYNSCILKVNQVGTVSGLIETLMFCKRNNIKTIISQRSGETDSNILPHLAVGLGADYMKAGAPARERIVKYNELLRL